MWGVRAAFLGAGCGGCVRCFNAVGSREVGGGACRAMRQQSWWVALWPF